MPVSQSTCREIFEFEKNNGKPEASVVSSALGYAKKTIYNCHYEYEREKLLSDKQLEPASGPEYDDFQKALEGDKYELWESFREYQKNVRKNQQFNENIQAQISPNDQGKAYLIGIGDLHIENIMAYNDKLESDIKELMNREDVGIIVPGDLSDNAVKYMDLSFETLAGPKDARRMAKMILGLVKDKILAMSSGCHERHSDEEADYNHIQDLCGRWDIPYLGHKGLITLWIGEQKYSVAVSHKGKGHSMYNDLHSAVRMVREQYSDADIVITAHTHQMGYLSQVEQGERRLMVSIGSYKQDDRYSRSRNFLNSQDNLNTPVIELDAKRKKFEVFHDISAIRRLVE